MTALNFLRRHGVPLWRLPALAAEFRTAVKGHMPSVRLFDGLTDLLRAQMARYVVGHFPRRRAEGAIFVPGMHGFHRLRVGADGEDNGTPRERVERDACG